MTEQNDISSSGSDKHKENLKSLSNLNEEIHEDNNLFENDAAEGLQLFPHDKIPVIIGGLNKGLQQHINKKHKKKRTLPDQTAVYITILTILLLAVVAYVIILSLIHI